MKEKVKLSKYLTEFSQKNKKGMNYPVYSVTNSMGFCTEYFSKDVSSKDKTNYKIVPYGYFAYNPSRVNVGSIDWQHCEDYVIVSPLYTIFKCSEDIDQSFLQYYFKSNAGKRMIESSVSGSVRANLKFKTLCNFEIYPYSNEEQKKIVKELDNIKELISIETKKYDNCNELLKSKFFEMFGDVNLNSKGYKVKDLTEIAEFWNGLTYRPEDVVDDDKGTLVLRSSNIKNGDLDFEDNVRVNCDIKERLFVKKNDILMCSRNGSAKLVGKVAMIGELDEKMSFGAFMMIIRSKYFAYLKPYFETNAFKNQLITGTSTINQITGNMLNKVKIPLPTNEEIEEYSKFALKIDELKKSITNRISVFKELMNKTMDKYFD